MPKNNKILVAIAFSSYTEGIFKYAAGLATQLGADLVVASIINERDVSAVQRIVEMGYEVDGDHYVSGIEDERRKQLDQLVHQCGFSSDRIETIFKVGNPIDELLKIIVSRDVDMVVMGLKGRTDLEHAFVGSVADKLFHRSPVTIVSYRDETLAKRLRKRVDKSSSG